MRGLSADLPCLPPSWPAPPQLLIVSRLPLVFDLDETLLVAKSQSQLSKELRSLRDVRRPALQRAVGDPQQAAKLAALDREEQLMRVRRLCSLPCAVRRFLCAPLARRPCHPCSCATIAGLSELPPKPLRAADGASWMHLRCWSCCVLPCALSMLTLLPMLRALSGLQDDLLLLQQFAENNEVTYRGQRFAAR